MSTNEQDLRREAIRRYLQGERPSQIVRDLSRSRSWFYKWLAEYQRNPLSDFSDHSRAPLHSPSQTDPAIVQAILSLRLQLETDTTPQSRYGLIGAQSIRSLLKRLHFSVLPSLPTIQRILAQHHLTHPLGAAIETAFYPWPTAWQTNSIFATDIITKHLVGGQSIQNFHTIDHFSRAVWLSQHLDKTSHTTRLHLLQCWQNLGRPFLHQFDNEGAFCGGHTHAHTIGQVIRLCLFCGVEPLFTPFYEPKRNGLVEGFHSLWVKGFWSRREFSSYKQVEREVVLFRDWYMDQYSPPTLNGQTPAQFRHNQKLALLKSRQERVIPQGRMPLTAGRVHFLRKVDPSGNIRVLNETWKLGISWAGEYIRATLTLTEQRITFWHQADAESSWKLVKSRRFRIAETIHELRPEFRRNCSRCLDYLPG